MLPGVFNRVIFSVRNVKKHKICFWIDWQIADDWFTLCDLIETKKFQLGISRF